MPYIDLSTVKMAKLPEKKKGQHRFVALATFVTSHEAIENGYYGTESAFFDHENLWDVSFGCIDCERPWTPRLKKFCEAPEYIDPKEGKEDE